MTLDQCLLDQLPRPSTIRDRLRETVRETELLRKLLRVAERAEQFRQSDVAHVSRTRNGGGV
jgi:hypothetical protein